MRLGVHVRHWEGAARDLVPLAREAERLGFDAVWTSETWGSDAIVLAAWLAAHTERIGVGVGIAQMPARTPAGAAMAALTLDHLSGGRFRLGLGSSGPQVAEGWHGVAFDRPLERAREYVDIVRAVLAREAPVTYEGRHYRLPAEGGTGLGKPLKANVRPLRPDLPIYLAAMGPRNVALAAEIADGWLPLFFAPDRADVFAGALREGTARRASRLPALDVAPVVPASFGDDLAACRDAVRPTLALYVGGYGSKGANFYHDLVGRYGYERDAAMIQDHFLAGRRDEAIAAVPDALVDDVALVGSVDRVAERLSDYAAAGASTVIVQVDDAATIRAIAESAERATVG